MAGDAFTRGFAAFTHTRFNPRPPLLAGDAKAANHMGRCGQVSIRARHCWRAMRRSCGWRSGVPSFNPRPPLLAGDAPLEFAQPICQFAFQSAPAIAGGRCHSRLVPAVVLVAFQSAPAIAGGRCFGEWEYLFGNLQFQSAPAIAGGRCWAERGVKMAYLRVNPRPPLLAGDAAKWRTRLLKAGFQSAPAIAGGRCASLPTPCQSCTFSCSRANVCSTIRLVKQTYASKEEKHRTTTTYEACEPVRRNAITPGSRRAR